MNFRKSLERYGRPVQTERRDGSVMQKAKGFIQPLRYKNKMYIEGTPTEIGINDAGYYLFIGSPDLRLDLVKDGGYITDGEKKYHIDRWEKMFLGNEIFYIWAVLKEYDGGDFPVYDHFR